MTYGAIRYPGDLVQHFAEGVLDAEAPHVLGDDPFGRPYEVLDAEYDETAGATVVQLQPAEPDTLRAHHAMRTALVEAAAATRMARLRFLGLFCPDPAAAEVAHLAALVRA